MVIVTDFITSAFRVRTSSKLSYRELNKISRSRSLWKCGNTIRKFCSSVLPRFCLLSRYFQGQFKESLPIPADVVGATKWCVFRQTEPSRSVVESAVRERMTRMRTKTVDLLQVRYVLVWFGSCNSAFSQFHWQDYSDKGYLTALQILQDLQNEGLIRAVGLCNFDTIRTDEICAQLGPGFIVSNQVQVRFSKSMFRLVFSPSSSFPWSIHVPCMEWLMFVNGTT